MDLWLWICGLVSLIVILDFDSFVCIFLLYLQPIDRPLLANQQSRLLSFTTVERYSQEHVSSWFPCISKLSKWMWKWLYWIYIIFTIIGQHYIMQNVSSYTKTDQASIITNRQYYDLELIAEIYLFTATSLSLFYSSNT